jgi:hypothetical protein
MNGVSGASIRQASRRRADNDARSRRAMVDEW